MSLLTTPRPSRWPPVGLTLAFLALLAPVGAALLLPGAPMAHQEPLLWLVALVPAFLLAYRRGWNGAAVALAGGMATLSLTQAATAVAGQPAPDMLRGLVIAFAALALGFGWLTERIHQDEGGVDALTLTDRETRLPNRRHARVFLEKEFAAAQRGRPLSVVLFDLDDFRPYCDRFGHAAGDEALRTFSEILARATRRMNLSARFGGKAFLAVLAGSPAEGALVFAERVRGSMRERKLPAGSLTVSAGVSSHHRDMRSPDELLAAAERALERARSQGGDCVRLFSPSHGEEQPSAAPRPGRAPRLLEGLPARRVAADPAADPAPAAGAGSDPHGTPAAARAAATSRPGVSDRVRQSLLEGARHLVEALEIRDPHLSGHHERVARYALEIARALDPRGAEVRALSLTLGAQLLDVGMIAVPADVLTRAGPLNEEELALVRGHVRAGLGILQPLLTDEVTLAVVAGHHERWDGGGYPQGLRGEAIPLSARIAAVADTLDALTSRRPYREPFAWERAVAMIQEQGGSKFDPRVVAAFQAALPVLERVFLSARPATPGPAGPP